MTSQNLANSANSAVVESIAPAIVYPAFRPDGKRDIVSALRAQGMPRSEAEAWFYSRLTAAAAAVTADHSAVSLKARKSGGFTVVYKNLAADSAAKAAAKAAAKIAKLEAKIAELKKA